MTPDQAGMDALLRCVPLSAGGSDFIGRCYWLSGAAAEHAAHAQEAARYQAALAAEGALLLAALAACAALLWRGRAWRCC